MANVFQHYLYCENIESMLRDAGVVSAETLHGRRNREIHRTILNMKKCCAEEWSKIEADAIAYGVVDCSKKGEDGHYGVRRDLTDIEIQELPYWPIVFDDDGGVVWECCWNRNHDPAFFISKLFPEVEFSFEVYNEGRGDGVYRVKDGNFLADEDYPAYDHTEDFLADEASPSYDHTEELPF